jgi:uncharacterized repeat protein (TIGR03803 family)
MRNSIKTVLTLFLLCTAMASRLPAQTLTTLYNFCTQTNCTDGATPVGGVIAGTDGNLYGMTEAGGLGFTQFPFFTDFGRGTLFKLTPGGLTTLYDFCVNQNPSNCFMNPQGELVQGTDGNFYGTTFTGGSTFCPNVAGCGTIFKVTPAGIFDSLYNFCGGGSPCADGRGPSPLLTQGRDGNFYGTTQFGGINDSGTIFKITPGGTLTTIYSFCPPFPFGGCPDGEQPMGGVVEGPDNNFYGTTSGGGTNIVGGTIFKVTSGGTLTTLYSFCSLKGGPSGCVDGGGSEAWLIQSPDGTSYGTTSYGNGTVFKIAPDGTFTSLYTFCSQPLCVDGDRPQTAGLFRGPDGNLYGTTAFGGANNSGTVFKVTPGGTQSTLYSFCPQVADSPFYCPDGATPFGGVIRGPDGSLYGTTRVGGPNSNAGTIFKLALPCNPPPDVTNSVGISASGFSYSVMLKRYAQTLTITSKSGTPINGPIYVVLDGLSPDATLYNPPGLIACSGAGTIGSPFVSIPGPLNSGSSVTLSLQFVVPTHTGFVYTPRVLAGPGNL